jgi:hypothetical protein
VDSLRLPLFFQSFDPEDERATVKILESISRFKNVGDLPEQTLKIVLANQALRTRLKDAEASNDEAFELVHEEILLLHKGTLEQLQATQNDLQEREKSLDVERQEREIVTKQAKDTETKVHLAEQTVQKLSAENADLIAKRSQEAENAEKQLKRALTAERTLAQQRYIGLFYILPAVMGSSLAYFTYPIAAQFTPVIEHGWQKWAFVAAIWLIPLCIAFLLSPWKVGNNQHLIDWWPVRVVHVIRKKLILAPLAAGVGAIYQGSVWDGIKNLLSGSP